MKGRINNKLGEIQISSDVIAMYAGMTAVECFGIVGMAAVSMKDGLVKLLKRESLTHGITVEVQDNHIGIKEPYFHRFSRDRGLWCQHLRGIRQSDRKCEIQSRRIHRHGG